MGAPSEALIGFQSNSLMIDYSLKTSIQIIKTELKVPCLNHAFPKIEDIIMTSSPQSFSLKVYYGFWDTLPVSQLYVKLWYIERLPTITELVISSYPTIS